MNNQPTNRPLDHWFNVLRSSTELSEDQVRKIITTGAQQRRRRFLVVPSIFNRRLIMYTVLVSSLLVGTLFIIHLGEGAASSQQQSSSRSTTSLPHTTLALEQTESKRPPQAATATRIKLLVEKVSKQMFKQTVTEPPHILRRQGIVALELTTEELANIGIQILPDGEMRLYAGMPRVNFFRGDSHMVETHTATFTIIADSGIEDWIPRQFSPAGIHWVPYAFPVQFYTENGNLHFFQRVENEEYDIHVNARRPKKTATEEAAYRRFWDSVEYSRFADPSYMRWLVPVTIKLQYGQRTIMLWLPVLRIASYLPDRYRIPIEAEIKRLQEIDELQARKLLSKKQEIVAYDIFKAPDSADQATEAANASAMQRRRLMEQVRPGDPVMETWWQSAGGVIVMDIAPNPARNVADLTFILEEPRMVALDLYRYDGLRVKRVAEGVSLPAGKHQLRADLSGISPGLYLLGVTTDRSEQALRRIYVMQ